MKVADAIDRVQILQQQHRDNALLQQQQEASSREEQQQQRSYFTLPQNIRINGLSAITGSNERQFDEIVGDCLLDADDSDPGDESFAVLASFVDIGTTTLLERLFALMQEFPLRKDEMMVSSFLNSYFSTMLSLYYGDTVQLTIVQILTSDSNNSLDAKLQYRDNTCSLVLAGNFLFLDRIVNVSSAIPNLYFNTNIGKEDRFVVDLSLDERLYLCLVIVYLYENILYDDLKKYVPGYVSLAMLLTGDKSRRTLFEVRNCCPLRQCF